MRFTRDFEERERPSHISVYRDATFLSQCSEWEARDWLKNRPVGYISGTPETPRESHVLEYILYRRNLPLIDLALAEHGRSRSVLERVFKRASSSTRVVACANASLFYGDTLRESIFRNTEEGTLLRHIVARGSLAELRAVCENPDLEGGWYGGIIGCWEGWEGHKIDISSDRFKWILFFLSKNPRISTPREESRQQYDYDPFAEIRYNELFTKGWKLAEIVPVEREWAFVLSEFYRGLHRPRDLFFDDVETVLARWRPADEGDSSLHDEDLSHFPSVREEIAAKFIEPSVEMLENNDPAIRQAFYRTFDPDGHEFRELDWTEWLSRDKHCHIWLESNNKIWRSSVGRQNLRDLLWHEPNDLIYVGFFDKREQVLRKTNPEWFENEQEESWDKEPEPDRVGDLERAVWDLTATFSKRRSTSAVWFLLAALIGFFIGAAICYETGFQLPLTRRGMESSGIEYPLHDTVFTLFLWDRFVHLPLRRRVTDARRKRIQAGTR